MDEQAVATPAPEAVVNDPFALDETKFASLAPEQRAALDPVLTEWKTRAKSELDKTTKTYEDRYRPVEEKAKALDELVKDPRFQGWWNNLANAASGGQGTQGTRPQDFATPEEWQKAVSDAYAGDGSKMREIQMRLFSAMASPVVQELKKSQEDLKLSQEQFRMTQEMRDLFQRHDDAKELDSIGRNVNDPNDKSESLLEMCLEWADKNGKSMEDGYAKARAWRDALRVTAEQKAMGLVQGKKDSVTSGPSTVKGGTNVVEVADADELMQRNMEYLVNGQTPPKFVIRRTDATPVDKRWAQRT